MAGADTGGTGGLTTPGGPGDTGSLDLLGHKSSQITFFGPYRAIAFLSIQGPMPLALPILIITEIPNEHGFGARGAAACNCPRNPYIAQSN
jgi:hypothetical protein